MPFGLGEPERYGLYCVNTRVTRPSSVESVSAESQARRSVPGVLHAGFKTTSSRPAPVHFIGVWDIVESLVSNEGRHRVFQPCLWDERNRRRGRTMEQV